MGFSLNTSFWLQSFWVLLNGDAEVNQGPTRIPNASLLICHCNLNSIFAHNYIKLSLLRVYFVFDKFYILCLSEMYLNSSNSPDDDTLEISRYNLVRSDELLNIKRGKVCIIRATYPYELSVSVIYQNG